MSENKSAAFHRLATKRVEGIEDAYRILSNLSGPSYEWTPTEVLDLIGRLDRARDAALARFQETRRWREAVASPVEADPVSGEPKPTPTINASPRPAQAHDEGLETRRTRTISAILLDTGADAEIMATQIALQREVINALQGTVDELRRSA